MTHYQFGISRTKPTRANAIKMAEIAEQHGAEFIQADLPEGYQNWFSCHNLGSPFDGAVRYAVLSEVAKLDQ